MNSSKLLSSVQLGCLSLPNRVVFSPLTRARAGIERIPNSLMKTYYLQRASAGLMITEATAISEQAIGFPNTPGIYNQEQIEGWQEIVRAVHDKGGRIALQLWHTGRASHSSFQKDGSLPVAPSAIAITGGDGVYTVTGKQPYQVPRVLETEEISSIVESYRQAAENAQKAGFDAIEIHGANGYLIDQFLQSCSNQRQDRYGGSKENRFQFLREIVETVLNVWDPSRIGVRLSPNGIYNGMGSVDYRESFLYYAEQLDFYKLAFLDIIDGLGFGFHGLGTPMILAEFRPLFSGSIIGNCGYEQASAETTLDQGNADLIAFGRAYISNPDLVERFTHNWPLNPPSDPAVWYSDGPQGYIDFPYYQG
jgi:N-ethylmaleimide reductase